MAKTVCFSREHFSACQNEYLNVGFSVNDESGRIVVRISDQGTGKLVRQIPSEETLEFARNVKSGKGLLLNTKI